MNLTSCDNCIFLKECLINHNTEVSKSDITAYSKSSSCYYERGIFWDHKSGALNNNPQNTPVRKWNGEGWLESWWIEEGKSVISFSYSNSEKDSLDIDSKRTQYFEKHNCKPVSLRCVMIPETEYNSIARP